MFGGYNGSFTLGDTRLYDGRDWLQINPSAMTGHAVAFDSTRNRTVMFGGSTTTYRDSTWEWDGTRWVQKSPTAIPPARASHALAFDSTRARTVLFGGTNGTTLGDTWEYEGTTWTQLTTTVQPSARTGHAMVFDAARNVVTLFGGTGTSGFSNQTWDWNGTAWTLRTSPANPLARAEHAMAFDSARNKVVLYGGFNGSNLADTWEWNGTSWLPMLAAQFPSARYGHSMAYDSQGGVTVLYGGYNGSNLADTWEWNGTAWAVRSPSTSPSARTDHALAYDSLRGRTVLYGGSSLSGSTQTALDQTWELDTGTVRAIALPLGTGCGAPAMTMASSGGSRPIIGQNYLSTIQNAPGGLAFVAVGFSRTFAGPFPLPFPLDGFGVENCLLYQSCDSQFASATTSTGATSAQHSLPVLNLPSLVGLPVYLQAWGVSPGYNTAGIIVSNAMSLTVGNS